MEDQHGNIFTQIHSLHSHCHFSQEYLQHEHSFSSEVSELCKHHLPNPQEFMATEEIFSSTFTSYRMGNFSKNWHCYLTEAYAKG